MGRTEHRLAATVLAVVLVLAGCGAGGSPSAEEVAHDWRQALEKGDYETTWDLEGPNMQGAAGKAAAIADRKERRFGQPLSPERAALSIKALRTANDPDHSGDVWVYLQVNTQDAAQAHQEAVGLSKIGGSWRVQRSEPFVSPVGP